MVTKKKTEDNFTVTEVGTLVESLRNDISVIAEDLTSVKNNVNILRTDVHELKNGMKIVRDVVRIAIPSLSVRVSSLEAKVGS